MTGPPQLFTLPVGERPLHGVDLIEFNDSGKIIGFEVMIRPANASLLARSNEVIE